MNENIKINTVPSLTWNWMKMNNDIISLKEDYKEAFPKIKEDLQVVKEDLDLSSFKDSISLKKNESGICNIPNPKLDAEEFAPGYKNKLHLDIKEKSNSEEKNEKHPLYQFINEKSKNPQNIIISQSLEKPLILTFSESENYISVQNILAKKGTSSNIIFLYTAGEAPADSIIQTRVYLEENASVNIIKVQLLGKNDNQLDDTVFICQENAKGIFTQIELGGKHIDSGLHVSLEGYKSTFKSNVAYLCQENQHLDMNHIVYHYGKKTESNMDVRGSLKANAVKTYRGTIDFKNGSTGAKGYEMEETLLLNPGLVNKSLPIILCDEEDVEGEHGSTIGKLSNDILFYMQSRGIDKAQAEEIMTQAKIHAVADKIPSEFVEKQINDFIEGNYGK